MRLRGLNRWHLAFAGFMLLPLGFLSCEGLMRTCTVAVAVRGRYCSTEQTLYWLRHGDGWEFWLLASAPFVLYAVMYGALVLGFIRSTTE